MLRKNRKSKVDAVIALFLSLLAVMMPISFTTLQPEFTEEGVKQNSTIGFLASVLSRTVSFFDIIPNVMADDYFGCCEETNNGAKCIITFQNECKPNKWHNGTACDSVCQIGCCIDSQGMCSKNAINIDCQLGTFIANDLSCEQSTLCKEGCCTIGYQKFWTTNLTCVDVRHGVWDGNVPDEVTCIGQAYEQTMGCCKSYAGCEYITGAECNSKAGGFFTNTKCYQNVPGCEHCIGENIPKCIEGFPDLYRTDKCDNVYSDEVKDSCAPGFCNPETNQCESGTCTGVYDNWDGSGFTDLPSFHNKDRENGESWCVYDRPDLIGKGTDPVGSRHWRRYCLYGKEYSEPCADYRQQICSETLINKNTKEVVENLDFTKRYSGNYVSISSCIANNWKTCILTQSQEECEEYPTCFWVTDLCPNKDDCENEKWAGIKEDSLAIIETDDLDIGNVYAPARCLPKTPPGFDEGFGEMNNKDTLCETLAGYSCVVEDRLLGGDTNGECDNNEWLYTMAKRCRAVGDCGAWINYLDAPGHDTFTIGGIAIAEINPEKDANDNVIGKEIERWISVYRDSVGVPSGAPSIGWLGAPLSGFLVYLVWPTLPWTFLGSIPVLGGILSAEASTGLVWSWGNLLHWGSWAGGEAGWGAAILNPFTIAGAILLIVAHFMPMGPGRALMESIGAGLGVGGIAAGLGIGAAPVIGIIAGIGWALFFAVWDVDHMVVQCMPYMPPVGGDDCDVCGADSERPCSKYRCESLGSACIWNGTTADGIPCEQGTDCGVCHAEINDGIPPLITRVNVDSEFRASPEQPGMPPTTIIISKSDGQPIDPWTTLPIELEFNERAVCKWHTSPTLNFDEMPPLWFGSNSWKMSQAEALQIGQLIQGHNTIQIYLRCADVYMNANTAEYTIQFTVTTTDLTPPIVLGTDRDYHPYFGHSVTELPLSIYVNEMASCRWSKQDQAYELMSGEQCETEPIVSGFECNTNLTGLVPDIPNYFYIRCNDTSGNINQQSYELMLHPTPPLLITSIDPADGSTIKGCEVSGVELEAMTNGGADNGIATCYWSNADIGIEQGMTKFTETNDVVHRTNLSAISQTVYIKCHDSVLNIADNRTSFSVISDIYAPKITRIYKSGGSLFIRTDEDATCSYHYSAGRKIPGCDFAANDTLYARLFSTGGTEHSTEWDETGEPWYVKCYDECMNGWQKSLDCTVIYPSDFD